MRAMSFFSGSLFPRWPIAALGLSVAVAAPTSALAEEPASATAQSPEAAPGQTSAEAPLGLFDAPPDPVFPDYANEPTAPKFFRDVWNFFGGFAHRKGTDETAASGTPQAVPIDGASDSASTPGAQTVADTGVAPAPKTPPDYGGADIAVREPPATHTPASPTPVAEPTAAQEPGTSKDADESRSKGRWTAWPSFAYSRVTSLSIGGAVNYIEGTRRGIHARLQGIASLAGQWQINLEFTWYRVRSELSLYSEVNVTTFPQPFNGLGNTTPKESLFDFSARSVEAQVGLGWFFTPTIELRLFANPEYRNFTQEADFRAAGFNGALDGVYLSFPVQFRIDTRNHLYRPSRGVLAVIGAELAPFLPTNPASPLVTEPGAVRFSFDYRHFVRFADNDRLVLGVRAFGATVAGDAAWPMLTTLGGYRDLRGILFGRYRGPHAVVLQAEFRFPIWWILEGDFFVEAGRVWSPTSYGVPIVGDPAWTLPGGFHPSAGVGLRFALPPDGTLITRFEFAISADQWSPMFILGHAF
jgi:hypothetical protein